MNPLATFITALGRRIRYTIFIIGIISVLVYIFSKKYYEEKPRFYYSEALLFPVSISSAENSQLPEFLSSFQTKSSAQNNFYNLNQLLESRTIREEISKHVVYLNNRPIYVFDQAIRDFNKNPENKSTMKMTSDFHNNVILGAKALQYVIRISIEEEGGFIKLYCDSYNQDFAVALGNVVIEVLSDFYVKFNEKPLNYSYQKLGLVKDSLQYQLNMYETAYAKYLDENRYLASTEETLTQQRFERRINSIQSALNTVSQSYYSIKNQVAENKPILKVLDRPEKPLSKEADKYRYYPIAWALLSFIILLLLSNVDIMTRYLRELINIEKQKLINQEG